MEEIQNTEFYNIINPIESTEEYQKLKQAKHHGITRYEHSMRVAYYSYIVTKRLGLDYKETTEAALLHDFFLDEVKDKNPISKLRQHPEYAVSNASKIIDLSDKQVDIIKTHMFPVTFTPPKYLESWIVDIVDDVATIRERGSVVVKHCKKVALILYVLFFSINF